VYPCNGLEDRFWKESMGNIRDAESFEQIWFSKQAEQVRDKVKTCPKNCWMVGTAAPVMKKYLKHPLLWVLKNKIKSFSGKQLDRSCLPTQYPVGQDKKQGDLRSQQQFAVEPADSFPHGSERRFKTRVIKNEQLTKDAFRLTLEKGDFQFIPGQYASIGPYLEYHKSRDYTFCSSPDDEYLEFLIKEIKNGQISPYLKNLNTGDKVELVGPYGDFFINPASQKKHLFIATGVGIGPFLSSIKTYPGLNYEIIHGIKTKADLAMIENISIKSYTSCITREKGGDFNGRVTEYLNDYKNLSNTSCYLCGNPYMLKQACSLLLKKEVSLSNISMEPYFTY
jgi:ferredoxin--NADP+ reductase